MSPSATAAGASGGRQPVRSSPDPGRLAGWLWEEELDPDRRLPAPALTLFLVGARCPFSCVFCDLAAQTVPTATPPGAIPEQIRQGLAAAAPLRPGAAIKLYNASNFFDERAVPAVDDAEIARRIAPFSRVTVECHPRLIGERCFRFAERLDGALEVAMGLETIAPRAFPRLRKGMVIDDFARAARTLAGRGIGVRAFVLLSPPFVASTEAEDWAVRSVEHAVAAGARRVAVIPTRSTPELERLAGRGEFAPPTLSQLEAVIDRTLELPHVAVAADLWGAERSFAGESCLEARLARLRHLACTGRPLPPHRCPVCAGQSATATVGGGNETD